MRNEPNPSPSTSKKNKNFLDRFVADMLPGPHTTEHPLFNPKALIDTSQTETRAKTPDWMYKVLTLINPYAQDMTTGTKRNALERRLKGAK